MTIVANIFAEIPISDLVIEGCSFAFILLILAALWSTFTKAGEPGWNALVPILNFTKLLEIAERPTWWVLAILSPLGGPIFLLVWLEASKKLRDPQSAVSRRKQTAQTQSLAHEQAQLQSQPLARPQVAMTPQLPPQPKPQPQTQLQSPPQAAPQSQPVAQSQPQAQPRPQVPPPVPLELKLQPQLPPPPPSQSASKARLSSMIDFPLIIAAVLTGLFYVIVTRPQFEGTLIRRYTCEHFMEYVVVAIFIWGLVDAVFRACAFPQETIALRHFRFEAKGAKEPVEKAKAMYADLLAQPKWFLDSRFGRRLVSALRYINGKGSADGFNDYLLHLQSQDDDRTHANYGLMRFICWVAPVLGILGTVIHFGSAFAGMSIDQIGDSLPKVLGEIGSAFSTTTVALAAAITMMLCLYLCERTERSILNSINGRVDLDLLNRFEVVDESLTPFLHAVQSSSQVSVQAMAAAVEKQLQLWSGAFSQLQQKSEQRLQTHAQIWEQSLVKVHERFEQSDVAREQKLTRLTEETQSQRTEHKAAMQGLLAQIAGVQSHFAKLTETLTNISRGEGELVKLQGSLADNVRTLRETQQLDQAMHGLTAAIHLLTARHDLDPKGKRAA